MKAWEDGDCPWCRSLLGPGRALAETDTERRNDHPGVRGGKRLPAWVERARLVIVPVAALTVVAALVMTLT
ncbi:hypothetical protein ABZV31_26460 [Streptomyces sp. NPDC005202]|uniref:hypothetical protein n=1 Tax=Streptomyces sp. NPDC005202 TaxID=3157021 RepID=UPI0033BEA648